MVYYLLKKDNGQVKEQRCPYSVPLVFQNTTQIKNLRVIYLVSDFDLLDGVLKHLFVFQVLDRNKLSKKMFGLEEKHHHRKTFEKCNWKMMY